MDHVKAFLPTPFLTSGVWDPEGPRTNYKFAHLSVVGGAGSGAANLSELGQLIQELNGRLKVRRVDDSFEEAETCLAKIKTWASVNLLVVEGGGGEEEKVQEDNNNVQKMRDLFKFPDHPDAVAQEVLVQCIMNIGSKSFSHLLNAFER